MSDVQLDFTIGTVDDSKSRPPSGWKYLSRGGHVRCAFSSTRSIRVGMGVNVRTHDSQSFWFVEQTGPEEFVGRLINDRHVPAGEPEPITLLELINRFVPEPHYYEELVLPAMRLQPNPPSEDWHIAAVEEKNVIALFGLALIYLVRDEEDRCKELIHDLVAMKSDFPGKDQHLFNEFGIALRKSMLFTEAVVCFRRALEFVEDDEHLYYNLARAYYENGNWEESLNALIMSHRLNPNLEVTRNLFEVMVGLEDNEALLKQYAKPPVPPSVAARARQILAAGSGRLRLDEEPVGMAMGTRRAKESDREKGTGRAVESGRARSGRVGKVELKRHGRKK